MKRARARRASGKSASRKVPKAAALLLPHIRWEIRTDRPQRVTVLDPPPAPSGRQLPLIRLPLRRQKAKKPRTLGAGPLTRKERAEKERLDRLEYPSVMARRKLPVLQKPAQRGGCASIPRPCPFVRCVKNLYLTETDDGVLKKTYPDLEPWQMDPEWSCSADSAARGPAMVEEVAYALNMTDERVRQIQVGALAKLKAIPGVLEMLLAARDDDGP